MAHDLSFEVVVLDYDLLKSVAAIAIRRSLWDVELSLRDVQSVFSSDMSRSVFASKTLSDAAKDLHTALETYYYLVEGDDRNKMIQDPKFFKKLVETEVETE